MAERVSRESIEWAVRDTRHFAGLARHKLQLLGEETDENERYWMLWMFLRARSYARHSAYMAASRMLTAEKMVKVKHGELFSKMEAALRPWWELQRMPNEFVNEHRHRECSEWISRRLNQLARSEEIQQRGKEIAD